jgi:Zn-dependent oligopeptidase
MMEHAVLRSEPPNNPLLVTEGLPRYDKILPEHVLPAAEFVLDEMEQNLTAL